MWYVHQDKHNSAGAVDTVFTNTNKLFHNYSFTIIIIIIILLLIIIIIIMIIIIIVFTIIIIIIIQKSFLFPIFSTESKKISISLHQEYEIHFNYLLPEERWNVLTVANNIFNNICIMLFISFLCIKCFLFNNA